MLRRYVVLATIVSLALATFAEAGLFSRRRARRAEKVQAVKAVPQEAVAPKPAVVDQVKETTPPAPPAATNTTTVPAIPLAPPPKVTEGPAEEKAASQGSTRRKFVRRKPLLRGVDEPLPKAKE